MLKFIKSWRKGKDIRKVAERQLEENMSVIKSLRDYDQGKKDISTTNIERRLPDIRVAR
jgi:hypothetical protein